MSLQFILGPSGSGKTRFLYEEIIRESMEHPERQYLFLVPEQYTMQTQKEIITLHPRHGLTNVDVLSFNRLAYRVFEDLAVETLTVLDDMGKSMILRKVASQRRRELHYYQRHLNQMGFVNQLKSLLSEMYQYGVTPSRLEELQEKADQPILKEKLADFGLVFGSFQEYIADKFTTAEEVLDLCCRELPRWEKLKSSQIYLDGYTGFTPVQYRILEICLQRCGRVRAAVTADLSEPVYAEADPADLFYMSRHMICRLIDVAAHAGAVHEPDVILGGPVPVRFRERPELAFLERNLMRYGRERDGKWAAGSGQEGKSAIEGGCSQELVSEGKQDEALVSRDGRKEKKDDWKEVLVLKERNPAMEVQAVCGEIQSWLRSGMRYRDMAVITGDLASYGREIRKQFEELGIPYFLDDKKSILSNPLVELIRSALETVRMDFPYESLFRCLKTGLVLEGEDEFRIQQELDRMENYVKALGIRGYKRWSECWERQYRGAEELNLEELNQLREAAAKAFSSLRTGLKEKDGTGFSMTAVLRSFLEQLGLDQKLQQRADRLMDQGLGELSKEYSQVYELTLELFDRLEGLLGDEPMSLKEYQEILDAGFGEIQVGAIPATVDRVVVGDITRTRLDNIKVLYFVGVNEGVVPQRKENRGLLTDEEREFFASQQIELAPSARENGLMQRFYLYLMLTKPSHQLVVTYAAYTGSGKELRPSSLIGELTEMFPHGAESGRKRTVPYSFHEAVRLLAGGLRELDTLDEENSRRVMELFSYLYSQPEYQEQAGKLAEAFAYCYQDQGIGRAAARALYGNILQGSVTRLEQYAACAYSHFLRYGLELMERQEYELGAVDMGNLFHQSLDFCFEALREQGLNLAALSQEERQRLVLENVSRAAEDYGNTILHSSSRNAYLIRRISRITERTMWALGEQLKKGDFKPVGFEVSFSAADNLNAMKIALSEDEALYLKGRIDRLDLCEDETHVYVKIIDYKSGSTSFDLAALYYGLQLQLVVYMDAAMELEERRHPDKEVVPAGLFYYHIQDPMVEKKEEMTPEEIEAQIKKQLKMNGLVNSDLDVIRRLDREIEGESDVIPVALKAGMIQEARSSVASGKRFAFLRDYVRTRCQKAGQEILQGNIGMQPYQQGNRTGCDYCPYHAVCGFDRKTAGFGYRKLRSMKPEEIWKEILPEEEDKAGAEAMKYEETAQRAERTPGADGKTRQKGGDQHGSDMDQ
ncbi:MAG: PD-(D/E)XK nuclease family protein [Lachnospiraceae bacterium]|nr:PD-(D/E)XK nuclease family protein [Lachnospiraceae bacterium]